MEPTDLYAFDVRGYLVVPGILSVAQLEVLNAEVSNCTSL
jgi:hypothetical protein